MIRPAANAAPADWLLGAPADWWDLVRYGPPGFEVYARVDLGVGADHEGELPPLRDAITVLTAHTTTPGTGYAAVWEGCLDPVPAAPRVRIPNRTMVLLAGPVNLLRDAPKAAWDSNRGPIGLDYYEEPHLVWPEDRAWCVACEVDEEIEFSVGCSAAAYESLERELPGVRRVAYGEDAPLYRS